MTHVLVVVACVALEGAKCTWHAHERARIWLIVAHGLLAAVLAGLLWPPLALVAAGSVVASATTLDSKRRGEWLGAGLSALSSWPWQISGLASLGWLGLALAPLAGWLAGLWWVSGIRPAHWTESLWSALYPRWLVVALGGRACLLLLAFITGCAGTLPPAVRTVAVEAHAAGVRTDSVAALVVAVAPERAQVAQVAAQVAEAVQVTRQALERPPEVVARVTERARADVSGLLGQIKAHGARLEDLQGELSQARRFGSAAAGVVDSLRALVQSGRDDASSLRDGLAEVQAVLALARQGGGALGILGALAVAGLALWRRRRSQ